MPLSRIPETADPVVTTSKAAQLLGVSQRTIHYWMERGIIKSWKTAGGHCRIPMSSINLLLAKRREQLQDPDLLELTVLLVEDDENLREITKAVVANWGLPVRLVVAEDGYDGLIQAGLHKPEVIIADLMMPAMDGFQMIRALRESSELNRTRIIVVTAMDEIQIADKGGVPEDVEVFQKPTPYDRLKVVVMESLFTQQRSRRTVLNHSS
ncbi:MAG: response regulator [Magnetococcales bacterium]|jgi:excisionase family DNA binding protein|nr:response regulator [Magnetococcales bacterium]